MFYESFFVFFTHSREVVNRNNIVGSKINNNRDLINNITMIITIRIAILMKGTMNNIMLMIINTTIQNPTQVKEK